MSSYVPSQLYRTPSSPVEKTSRLVGNAASYPICSSCRRDLRYTAENGHPSESPVRTGTPDTFDQRFNVLPRLATLRRDVRPLLPVLSPAQPPLRSRGFRCHAQLVPTDRAQPHHALPTERLAGRFWIRPRRHSPAPGPGLAQ